MSRSSFRALAVSAALLFAASIALAAHQTAAPAQDPPRSARDGVYTKAQAERGAEVWKARCLDCHAPQQYTGEAFMRSWHGQPASALFDLIRTTMPEDSPSSLSRPDYSAILAYLFQLNRLPAGNTDLPSTDEGLKQVVIEGPEKERP